jgi:hypothetical protein
MRRIDLFAEDAGHEAVLLPLLQRVAEQYGVELKIRAVSVRGGYGKVATELREYVRDLLKYQQDLPDLVVVATDANCSGFQQRRKRLQETIASIRDRMVFAVPDPHIERWLLRDPSAFKAALGRSCRQPDQKCDRGRYKALLRDAIREAGAAPLLGGLEHAQDIVGHMNLGPTSRDDDFGEFLQQLHARFRRWGEEHGRDVVDMA